MKKIEDLIKESGLSSLEAEVLLGYVLKTDRAKILARLNEEIEEEPFIELVRRRRNGEPLAYLIKNKEFYGLDFYVDNRVLVPRPETEMLVEGIINKLQAPNSKQIIPRSGIPPCGTNYKLQTIVDVGTGSGCIAITLKKTFSEVKIIAIDISKDALEVAKINAEKHRVEIDFREGDLLEPVKEKIDVVVANLPYLNWDYGDEPAMALKAGKTGFELYEKLLKQLPKDCLVFLEIDPLIEKYFEHRKYTIKKDLQGLSRLVFFKN